MMSHLSSRTHTHAVASRTHTHAVARSTLLLALPLKPRFSTLLLIPFMLLGLGLLGCGSSDNDSNNMGQPGSPDAGTNATFACGQSGACQLNNEYCLRSTDDDVELTQDCVSIPTSCGAEPACDCIEDDAVIQNSSCTSAFIACSIQQSNDSLEIDVECSPNF